MKRRPKRGPTSRSITTWTVGRHVDEKEDFEPENMQERSTKQIKISSRSGCKEPAMTKRRRQRFTDEDKKRIFRRDEVGKKKQLRIS